MAYQLIYTSAPRLLEAGRSGFGTVARHREIPPLMVASLERISQFSRLPGADSARVVYSHRVLTAAGRSSHVLSAIRDAGADYTGRTNHIAHHLVVDPREIAALGPACPSPAEVLRAMEWATEWQGNPVFLEGAQQVALAALRRAADGSAWERLTGQADQAWLLAAHGTNRGICLISPSTCDLREIYDESLRLIPERLWQIPFTTSLQPSDETSDFRWTGIEEHGSLRSQVEGSGRLVLNLANPERLPLAEKPKQKPLSAPTPLATTDLPRLEGGIPAEPNPAAAFISEPLTPYPEGAGGTLGRGGTDFPTPARHGEGWGDLEVPHSRKSPKRSRGGAWKLIGAAVFLLGMLLAIREMRNRKYLEETFSALDRQQDEGGYFQRASQDMQGQIRALGSRVIPSAQALFAEATQAVRLTMDGEIEQAQEALKRARDQAGVDLNIPPEINIFEAHLKEFSELKGKIVSLEKKESFTASIEAIEKRGEFLKGRLQLVRKDEKSNIFKKYGESIEELIQERKFTFAHDFIINETSHPEVEEEKKVKTTLDALKKSFKTGEFEEKIAQVEGVLEDWKKLSTQPLSDKNPAWPEWLKAEWDKKNSEVVKTAAPPSPKPKESVPAPVLPVHPLPTSPTPAPVAPSVVKSSFPIYILNGLAEFRKGVEISEIDGNPVLHYRPFTGSQYIRLRPGSIGYPMQFMYGTISEYCTFITILKSEEAKPRFTIFLSGQDAFAKEERYKDLISQSFIVSSFSGAVESGSREFQIHVKNTASRDSPLWTVPKPVEGLFTRNGGSITIHPNKIPLAGKPIGELSVDIEAGEPGKKLENVAAHWDQTCVFSIEKFSSEYQARLSSKKEGLKTIQGDLETQRVAFKKRISGILEPGTYDFFVGKGFDVQRKRFSQALGLVKKEYGKVSDYFERAEEGPISFSKVKWEASVEGAYNFLTEFNRVFLKFSGGDSGKKSVEIKRLENILEALTKATLPSLVDLEKNKLTAQERYRSEIKEIEEIIAQLNGKDVPPWRYKLKIKRKDEEVLLLNIDLRGRP